MNVQDEMIELFSRYSNKDKIEEYVRILKICRILQDEVVGLEGDLEEQEMRITKLQDIHISSFLGLVKKKKIKKLLKNI